MLVDGQVHQSRCHTLLGYAFIAIPSLGFSPVLGVEHAKAQSSGRALRVILGRACALIVAAQGYIITQQTCFSLLAASGHLIEPNGQLVRIMVVRAILSKHRSTFS